MCHHDLVIIDNSSRCEHLICGIGKGILENPINLNCGHTFCKECIGTWVKIKKVCPLCMVEINYDLDTRATNFILKNIIENINVKCSFEGCNWTGKLFDMESHNKNECSYFNLKCKYEKCNFIGVRENVLRHEAECEYQILECVDCKCKIEKKMLDIHNEICLEKNMECGYCKKLVKKIDSLKHQKNCDYYLMPCPYKAFGCTGIFHKKDLDQHLKENYYHYLIHNRMLFYTDFLLRQEEKTLVNVNNMVIQLWCGSTKNKLYAIFAVLIHPKIKNSITLKVNVMLYDYDEKIYIKTEDSDKNINLCCDIGYSVTTFKNCNNYADVENKFVNFAKNSFIKGKIMFSKLD